MIHVAYTISHDYVDYLYVSILSLMENNARNKICLHILSMDLSTEDEQLLGALAAKYDNEISFYKIPEVEQFRQYVSRGYSLEVYMRLFLPWKLSGIDKVLFLDADTYINSSIRELYDTNLEGMALAGVLDAQMLQRRVQKNKDLFSRTDDFSYFNAGVMLWNLEYFRGKVSISDYLEVISRFGTELKYNDQDILNYLFNKKIVELDKKYNLLSDLCKNAEDFEKQISDAVIIHFAGCNPWKSTDQNRVDMEIWWHIARKTPCYVHILEKALDNIAAIERKKENENRLNNLYVEYKMSGYNLFRDSLLSKCSSISLYGAGAWGKLLLNELSDNKRFVKYCFDKDDNKYIEGNTIKGLNEISLANSTDILIITPSGYYDEIRKELSNRVNIRMISLIELFESCLGL